MDLLLRAKKAERTLHAAQQYKIEIQKMEAELAEINKELSTYFKAREIVNGFLERYRSDTTQQIRELVQQCLEYFIRQGEDYAFYLEQRTTRNTQGISCGINSDGEQYNLVDDTGDGIIEAIAFALRISIWLCSAAKTDPVFILDEPFAGVDKKRIPMMVEFIKYIADEFGVQFIIITHNKYIAEQADKVVEL